MTIRHVANNTGDKIHFKPVTGFNIVRSYFYDG